MVRGNRRAGGGNGLGKFPSEEPPTAIRDFSHLDPQLVPRPARVRLALSAVPVLAVTPEELSSVSVDHRAGFLLSLLDGETTIEALLDVSAMPRDETLSILQDLVGQGIVSLR